MSLLGALIEGAVLPAPGAPVRLCRGSLVIVGHVVWRREGRAGLRFQAAASVDDWLPSGRALAPQQRIDEIVQQTRAAGIADAAAQNDHPVALQPAPVTALELCRLRHAVESLAEDLANDPAVVARHAAKLQVLDVAAQTLKKLGETL